MALAVIAISGMFVLPMGWAGNPEFYRIRRPLIKHNRVAQV